MPGWSKKMSYCIAFSSEGATDVTRRYVRNAATHGVERTRAPEEVLFWIINEIRVLRRKDLPKEERRRIIAEDQREEKELSGYIAKALAAEIGRMLPSGQPASGAEQKSPATRSENATRQEARVEDASPTGASDQSPREAHG